MSLLLEHQRKLAGGRRLAGALQPDKHDHRHARRGERDLALRPAQKFCQLIPDDFDNRLVWLQAAEDLLAHRFFTHMSNEILRYLEIDVRFQKSPSDFAERRVDITLGKFALPAEILKSRLQLIP